MQSAAIFRNFFPNQNEKLGHRERVEEARDNIIQANEMTSAMQVNLEEQNTQLDALLVDIEEKK